MKKLVITTLILCGIGSLYGMEKSPLNQATIPVIRIEGKLATAVKDLAEKNFVNYFDQLKSLTQKQELSESDQNALEELCRTMGEAIHQELPKELIGDYEESIILAYIQFVLEQKLKAEYAHVYKSKKRKIQEIKPQPAQEPKKTLKSLSLLNLFNALGKDANLHEIQNLTSLSRLSLGVSTESTIVNAVLAGHAPQVRDLLAASNNVNAKDKAGAPLLVLAARNGHYGVVKVLLDHKVDVTATDALGNNALHAAVGLIPGDLNLVKLLIEAQVPLNAGNALGQTPLAIAMTQGSLINLFQ